MAQSVKCPTLDFSSGHDLTVHGIQPHVGLCTVSAWDSLSLPLSPACVGSVSLFLKINLNKEKKKKGHLTALVFSCFWTLLTRCLSQSYGRHPGPLRGVAKEAKPGTEHGHGDEK